MLIPAAVVPPYELRDHGLDCFIGPLDRVAVRCVDRINSVPDAEAAQQLLHVPYHELCPLVRDQGLATAVAVNDTVRYVLAMAVAVACRSGLSSTHLVEWSCRTINQVSPFVDRGKGFTKSAVTCSQGASTWDACISPAGRACALLCAKQLAHARM